jgi:MFS family permease
MTGSLIMIAGSIIQGFAVNGEFLLAYIMCIMASLTRLLGAMYIVARLIIGFGLPYAIVAGSSLIGELAYPKERAVLTSLFNAAYFIGAIVASGITYGTQLIPSDWYVQVYPVMA